RFLQFRLFRHYWQHFLCDLNLLLCISGHPVRCHDGGFDRTRDREWVRSRRRSWAISGAVFSIEVFESSLVLWQSDESGIGCLLYLIDVIASLLSGRLVRERIGPAMLSAVQSQMGASETPFEEVQNIFDTGGVKGLAGDLVEKIPKIIITKNNNVDASGEKVSCTVCLQDFQLGETVRSLPQCHHMFHLPCIDKWLVSHASCPLCRRDL
ncbi:hypothetical protein ERO13_A11G171900v2, partial [Gossypium hirsutum]